MTTAPGVNTFLEAYEDFSTITPSSRTLEKTYTTSEGTIQFNRSFTYDSLLAPSTTKVTINANDLLKLMENSKRYVEMASICCRDISESKNLSHQTEMVAPISSEPVKLTPLEEALSKKGTLSGLEYLLSNKLSGVTDEDIVGYIRAHPDEVKLKYDDGYNPLIRACYKEKSIEIVKSLIECGVDVNVCNNVGHNALHLVLNRNTPNLEVMSELIKAGVNLNQKSCGYTPIHYAASRSKEAVELLVTSEADLNIHDNTGRTALFWARNIETFKYLLNLNKVNLHHRDNKGRNVLDYFLGISDKAEHCRLLIDRNMGPTFNKLKPEELERYLRLVKP